MQQQQQPSNITRRHDPSHPHHHHQLTEEQQQFQLFQESLPKINRLVYQMLLNEIIPTSISVQNRLDESDDNSDAEQLKKLSISEKPVVPSHKLVSQMHEIKNEGRYNNILERIRTIGFKLGCKIADLLVFANNPNLNFRDMDLLAIMKFVCRDVWKLVFGKQIDNLKTNHRGTFYLIDYSYQPIKNFALNDDTNKLSAEELEKKELKSVEPFLELPVGIIKGVLEALGYNAKETICLATYIDLPNEDASHYGFSKGISFHVQVTNTTRQQQP
ncbi:hypothetical protein KAFR_0F00760 [Kazachstania africana CBS 2517]|uniref:Trafficking protein particle complex subunit n=1 Tax=Kazachstania africana (strain ATCC 22294 / BCRC 22015 / CBS 2517 / CECT 1963 / NBRC 1671 / NRRL Y-8276) TaxID=1071382 RepID=H2AWC3_KAZAF|nr:hypothetical protein KAFR_0F00760 [Kazachstania africana CBS 2517]CCF58673.1 hypothetical protein KAFR_0F00760 [Kazachstania africana CBS 2517]